MCTHTRVHTHTQNMNRGNFSNIVQKIFFSLVSLAKLHHSLNLNSAASAECSKWKEETDARVAGICSQLLLSLC